jgi:hypothetical protein
MDLINAFLLVVAGMFAGFINTIAGSGSLITLPLLMFFGLSPHVANGTNRVGILVQSLVAIRNFKKSESLSLQNELPLVLPSAIGALVGAMLAIRIDEKTMNAFIGALLIFMFFIILFKPEQWLKEHAGEVKARPSFWRTLIFFAIGVYGGFIQAGVGFFLLAGLVFSGYNLFRANAVKVLITLCYTVLALVIFVWNDQVNWLYGIVLAFGNGIGAYVASRYARRIGAKAIWIVLLVATFAAGIKVLGVFDLIKQWLLA